MSKLVSKAEAAKFLLEHDKYTILTHAHPDGDTLGSGFALCSALRSLGKQANVKCPDPIPHKFDYLTAEGQMDFEPETVISVDVADAKLAQGGDIQPVGGGTAAEGVHADIAEAFRIGHGSRTAGVQHDQEYSFHIDSHLSLR